MRIFDTIGFLRELEAEFAEEPLGLSSRRCQTEDRLFELDAAAGEPLFWMACTGVKDRDPVLREAVREAIKLATSAADRLEVASRAGKRSPDAEKIARLFRAFFCVDPARPVPWAAGEPFGMVVGRRLRAIARELGGGRRIIFACLETRKDCPEGNDFCCPPEGVNARSVPGSSTIGLCDVFWTNTRFPGLPTLQWRAGTIIHEMLHLLFATATTGIHDEGPRFANAHCYKMFVLRANGYGGDPLALEGCGLC